MRLGIIADTHDNLPKIKKAIGIFKKRGVNFVIHAGDYIAPFAFTPFENLGCEFAGVFGNNDGERAGLSTVSSDRIRESPLRLSLANRRITVLHDIELLNRGEGADLIIYGHTHRPNIKTKGESLYVNPGECCGWLTRKSSIAIVDLQDMRCQILWL